uniref:Dimer_Tnp_hAT domain-containing protein n=1 Tax=Meloidogyne hapla TaxID=6305 RepID=A0A1I8BX53_MELHA
MIEIFFFAKVSRYLKEEYNELNEQETEHELFVEPASPCSKRPCSFLDLMDEAASSSKQVGEECKGIEFELREYEGSERTQMHVDPLQWWHVNEKKFPRYLSAPSTSVASEQLFSVARDVFGYRRSSLSPMTAEMLIFLHNSIPDLNYIY